MNRLIHFCLNQKLVVLLLLGLVVGWGIKVAPFEWDTGVLERDPVPVDAIPDLGENQQIVFTAWPGRSPQDVEDQITYPMTSALLGVGGVRTVRSVSSICRSKLSPARVSRSITMTSHSRNRLRIS